MSNDSTLNRCLVLGTGGHARVLISMLRNLRIWEIVGCIDLAVPCPGESILGVPVVGGWLDLARWFDQRINKAFLAVGDNQRREDIFLELRKTGWEFPPLVATSAILDPTAVIGDGTIICAQAFLGPEATVGENSIVNTAASIDHESALGSHSHLAPGVRVAGRVKMGCRVFIGVGASVIDRLTICDEVIVGAGAVVVGSIEHSGTYIGVPARRLEK